MSSVVKKEPRKEMKYFSVEEANAALPYVKRVIEDIRKAYRRARDIERQLDQLMPEDDASALKNEFDETISRLNQYVEELRQVGVTLKDYEMGLVDFPHQHEGREVCLCWRAGEERIVAWHELDAGFAGRQDVARLEKSAASSGTSE